MCQNALNLMFPKLKLNFFGDRPLDFEKFQRVLSYLQSKSASSPSPGITLNEISDLYQDGPTPTASPMRTERQSLVLSNDDISIGKEIKLMLPPKDVALQLIYTTWYKACVLFRFYHRPSLLEEVELLYSLDPFNYTDRQQKFLPFLYSILACGSLFSKTQDSSNHESLEDDGFNYFLEARKLIDITNVGDIHSIQTIVMMIMYLQCLARLSTCYSYIGIALRSSLKEGLHRNLLIFQNSRRKLDPIEIDTRKRLFFTIYKMDIYINSLLGLPRSINEDEFDQELPEDLDDENITRDEYLYENQQGRLSSSGCANHHTKLMLILSHIIKELYPIKVKGDQEHMTPGQIHSRVSEIELELKNWLDNLPAELKPTDPSDNELSKSIPEKFLLANYYLHLAFLNCQIMLYRPFIHFISNGVHFQNSDPRSLIRGRNCIKVARMVVKLLNKMIDQNMLVGTYWFSMYTIFFSIACLIYYFHFANYNNTQGDRNGINYAGVLFDDDLNIDMIKKDIEIGKKVLDCLKNNSHASLRIYNILNNLFEQLNRRTASTSRVRGNPLLSQSTFDANDESVQMTFSNFDKMNNFKTSFENVPRGSSRTPLDGAALSEFSNGKANRDMFTSQFTYGEEPQVQDLEEAAPAQEPSNGSISENFVIPETGAAAESRSDADVDYLPGVIDKLDAQIFGRILPPYMLEKSAKKFDSLGQFRPDSDAVASFLGLGFDNYDLLIVLGDNNPLDYLDPFNPINAPDKEAL